MVAGEGDVFSVYGITVEILSRVAFQRREFSFLEIWVGNTTELTTERDGLHIKIH